ncbi:MAG: hypothetical protein GEV08_13805 [Acidimicrobiia bacterium]|nr:hypothetical protein [Acidimicrobiia bacterium]
MRDDDRPGLGRRTPNPPGVLVRADRGHPRLSAVLLLVGCLLVLGWHAVHGVDATNDLALGWWRDAAERAEARLACLAGELEELVPAGSRVVVTARPEHEEWRQRVLELVDRRGTVVDGLDGADQALVVAVAGTAEGCDGVVVRAA